LLARLPRGVQVVTVMSQCYSGAFAALADAPSDACGFFSTTAQQKAYGCYPEGRDRDRLGHAFEFIEALDARETAAEAHADVLARDDTPDAPRRTSDAYFERLLAAEAKARGTEGAAAADALLAEAWRDRARWEPEIRLLDRIGSAFGTFSPRTMAEVAEREAEVEAVAQPVTTYAQTWTDAFAGVKESALRTFVAAHPQWQPRLTREATAALAAGERARLAAELLPELLAFVKQDPLGAKVETFRRRADQASAARYRLEVRRAALQRMRTVLASVAGRVLAARDCERHVSNRHDRTGRHRKHAADIRRRQNPVVAVCAHDATLFRSVVAIGRRATIEIGYAAARIAVTMSRARWVLSACGSNTKKCRLTGMFGNRFRMPSSQMAIAAPNGSDSAPPIPTISADSHSTSRTTRRCEKPSARSAATSASRWFTETVSRTVINRSANVTVTVVSTAEI